MLYDIDTARLKTIRHAYFPGLLDAHGTHFTSIVSFATHELPDAGRGLFVLDVAADEIARISQGPLPQYVDEVAISSSGPFTAFTSKTVFDPTAATGDHPQIFLYDARDESLRQLTNRDDPIAGAGGPTLSADSSRLAYMTDTGQVRVVDLPSGGERFLLDVTTQGDYVGNYFLSSDGEIFGFSSTADLDPAVGNEDHQLQLFRLNLATGTFQQITDTRDIASFTAMDASATTFLLDFGGEIRVGSEAFSLNSARVIPRRRVNKPPVLDAPAMLRAYEGHTTSVNFGATDPERDPLTIYAQLADPTVTSLRDFSSVLDDHGDGTAQLSLTPTSKQIGSYRLDVAAFDEAGGVTLRVLPLIVEALHATGDANCDGRVDAADIPALLPALLDSAALPPCIDSGDVNGDGRLSIGDLVALVARTS